MTLKLKLIDILLILVLAIFAATANNLEENQIRYFIGIGDHSVRQFDSSYNNLSEIQIGYINGAHSRFVAIFFEKDVDGAFFL